MTETNGLCFRCEHRARHMETSEFDSKGKYKKVGWQPRCECGDIFGSKYSCYMFQPVKPVILAQDGDDPRPQFGGYFGSRSSSAGIPERIKLKLKEYKEGIVSYWVPGVVRKRRA